jgi:hypothetical protein
MTIGFAKLHTLTVLAVVGGEVSSTNPIPISSPPNPSSAFLSSFSNLSRASFGAAVISGVRLSKMHLEPLPQYPPHLILGEFNPKLFSNEEPYLFCCPEIPLPQQLSKAFQVFFPQGRGPSPSLRGREEAIISLLIPFLSYLIL